MPLLAATIRSRRAPVSFLVLCFCSHTLCLAWPGTESSRQLFGPPVLLPNALLRSTGDGELPSAFGASGSAAKRSVLPPLPLLFRLFQALSSPAPLSLLPPSLLSSLLARAFFGFPLRLGVGSDLCLRHGRVSHLCGWFGQQSHAGNLRALGCRHAWRQCACVCVCVYVCVCVCVCMCVIAMGGKVGDGWGCMYSFCSR